MTVTQHTFELLAVEDPEGHWELHRGRLREKPTMSFTHNEVMSELGFLLRSQLSSDVYVVRINTGRVKISSDTYYIPDIFVALRNPAIRPDDASALETYTVPLPLVVEVWSPSTGGYDIDTKIPEYRSRGDLEIWRVYPPERSVTVWTRRSDGSYDTLVLTSGVLRPKALPGVQVDIQSLFANI